MTVVLDRPELAVVPSQFDVDVALRGGERAARALACENRDAALCAQVIVGRCALAGYHDPLGGER